MHPLRNHRSYIAAMGHRLSGIALALFLPIHFLLLGSAIGGAEGLDRFLVYTELPLVKFAEWGLVVLLAIHFLFGIRVLLIEMTRWPEHPGMLVDWVVPFTVAALFVGVVFVFQVTA